MKINEINLKAFLDIPLKTKMNIKEKKLLAAFLIFIILILSLGITLQTFGKFSSYTQVMDSATVAKFDVIVTPPKEFLTGMGDSDFEYHFLSDFDIRGYVFQVTNNGETEILCRPYIDSDIMYRIYLDEKECTEFYVSAGETVKFWLVIAPDGLNENIKNAKFFIDTQQVEGR